MTKPEEENIKSTAQRVISMAFYGAKKEEAEDIPEFLAYEVVDLTEIMCENWSMQDDVIAEILRHPLLSDRTKQIIRKFF